MSRGETAAMQPGTKVIVYTLIIRGNAQTSYVGAVTVVTDQGLTIEGAAGIIFFPWSAIERVTY
jgi:hypothetical protein